MIIQTQRNNSNDRVTIKITPLVGPIYVDFCNFVSLSQWEVVMVYNNREYVLGGYRSESIANAVVDELYDACKQKHITTYEMPSELISR